MNETNALVIPDHTGFKGAVNEKLQLLKFSKFASAKLGIQLVKGKTFKECVAASGVSKDVLKACRAEFNGQAEIYHDQVRPFLGALVTRPEFRQSLKIWKTKAGKVAVNAMFRQTASLSESAANRARLAEAKVAKLEAQIAALLTLQNGAQA